MNLVIFPIHILFIPRTILSTDKLLLHGFFGKGLGLFSEREEFISTFPFMPVLVACLRSHSYQCSSCSVPVVAAGILGWTYQERWISLVLPSQACLSDYEHFEYRPKYLGCGWTLSTSESP